MFKIATIRNGSVNPSNASLKPIGGSTKRLLDIVIAASGIVILLPLFSLCILGILLTSQGSVIFRHRRLGFQGRHFDCLKFRTMQPNSDERLQEYLSSNPRANQEWVETRKLRFDPRVTPFGAILRKSSLDELPQLFNVLRGDMSIVGPRPVTDEEIERFADHVSAYLACRPGITGLWQVSGRSKTGYSERVRLDYSYAKSWSLKMDAKIVLSTLPALLGSENAY